MDNWQFWLELLVVLACVVMGTRVGGAGVGLWGGVGVAVLVFVFQEQPGSPPATAVAIILAVVTAAALMQAAGGIDWMVKIAAGIIERNPQRITLVAPLTAFAFSVGAGTSNILYPLMPVIYDVSYRNGIRPSRPMSVSVVQSGVALAASPVSAAMAAMLTLTDVAPYNLSLTEILAITMPSCICGIIVTSLVVGRMGPELADDPEVQEKIAAGLLPPIGPPVGEDGSSTSIAASMTATKEGRNAAVTFLSGVLLIVIFGLFEDLRPTFELSDGSTIRLDMTSTIVIIMFVVGAVIVAVGKPQVKLLPEQSVFKAGMVAAIALFGIAWMTATFIEANEALIVDTVGGWINDWRFIFALSVFVVAALTTSQSTATRTMVPIGLAAGLAPGLVTGMWGGAVGGVYSLPTGGPQIAGANFDLSGTTKLGTKLFDHSYFVPMLILTTTTMLVGSAIGAIFY
ncbi:MAG TPA: anaerobic C4-dicarboxylate transporter family protein [Ilumatobacteraceae bacterium]|nr:anaerobic C4-dicarboxylate transporter family protein [Ilumatobacteraceae bacterium]